MGRYARPTGVWFNPLAWVILVATGVFLITSVRQVPCVQTELTSTINAYLRLCYSDIPLVYTSSGVGRGEALFGGMEMTYPPVLALFIWLTARVAFLVGAPHGPDVNDQEMIVGSQYFYAVAMILLFVCFLVWVLAMSFLGRDSNSGRYRSWDAMLIAASPLIVASGLISWTLFPIALTALGLLLVARRYLLPAGIVLGIAASADLMPMAVVVAIVIALGLRAGARPVAELLGASIAGWLLLHGAALATNASQVVTYYFDLANQGASHGSIWDFLEALGLPLKSPGALGFLVGSLLLCCFVAWLYLRRAQPRIGTMMAIVVFAAAMLAPSFTPQTALWLLFALVLARPLRPEMIGFTVAQLGYWLAIWGWLAGTLAEDSNSANLYYLAILIRFVVNGLIVFFCIRDVLFPALDPLRTPDCQDPLGATTPVIDALPPQPIFGQQDASAGSL